MELYSSNQTYKLFHWNMLDMSEVIESWTIDSIVTDPPYELNFMWKGWDNSWIAFQPDTWKRCLEALKPWWYLLAFGGSRTYHRIACAIEDAGFEIRDCIMRLYGSWFPKSMALDKSIEWKLTTWSANKTEFKKLEWTKEESWKRGISKMSKEQWFRDTDYTADKHLRTVEVKHTTELAKQYKGWGTCLKPSYEPIIVARKPLEWSCTDNVIKYWVGGINIDECRVQFWNETDSRVWTDAVMNTEHWFWQEKGNNWNTAVYKEWGRFPANTILTYWDDDREEVCSGFPITKWWGKTKEKWKFWMCFWKWERDSKPMADWYEDEWSAARYFYNAKASRRDRDEGLPDKRLNDIDFILLFWDKEIWKGTSTIEGGNKALYDMDTSLKKAIEEYEMLKAKGIGWNTILYGRSIIEKYLNECKSTTEMKISSTTIYQILNWLALLNTRESTLDVKKYDELYTSHVESAENWSLLTLTIKERTELAHDAENAVLKMQLRIREKEGRNEHCTVKPTDLMQYLVRLVTPNGWTVLDPFNWSGSTGKAVMYENKDRNKNYKYIWIELTEEYLPIAKARIEYVINKEEEKSEWGLQQQRLF